MPFRIKRVYEPPAKADGMRVLVDKLWPRGLKKTDARLDLWMKDVAPSTELRKWFGHAPEKFAEFKRRYKKELSKDALNELRELGKGKIVTLLYGAKDPEMNQAAVLLALLKR
ncbi:MAG TPA: DUF488 domain-containing protein [Rhizomicrobium sp.]|nr:DUF488 domain-containing protein [Rhizomicrobium sp.]